MTFDPAALHWLRPQWLWALPVQRGGIEVHADPLRGSAHASRPQASASPSGHG